MFRACHAWPITSECRGVSAAHMSSARSLTSPPALTCSKRRWLHHLLRPRQASQALPFPPLFGHSSARLSSSFRRPASKQSKVLASFHFINTHNHNHQTIPDPPLLFHPRDSFLPLHSLHSPPLILRSPTLPTFALPVRTHSAHSNASCQPLFHYLPEPQLPHRFQHGGRSRRGSFCRPVSSIASRAVVIKHPTDSFKVRRRGR